MVHVIVLTHEACIYLQIDSWPVYIVTFSGKFNCIVCLIVVFVFFCLVHEFLELNCYVICSNLEQLLLRSEIG